MKYLSLRRGLTLLAAVLLVYGCSPASQGHLSQAQTQRGSAAQRVYMDSDTGAWREPTAAELSSPQSAVRTNAEIVAATETNRPTVQPDEVRLPDGTVGVRVAQQYFHTIVVCRQSDGSFSSECPATATRDAAPLVRGAGL